MPPSENSTAKGKRKANDNVQILSPCQKLAKINQLSPGKQKKRKKISDGQVTSKKRANLEIREISDLFPDSGGHSERILNDEYETGHSTTISASSLYEGNVQEIKLLKCNKGKEKEVSAKYPGGDTIQSIDNDYFYSNDLDNSLEENVYLDFNRQHNPFTKQLIRDREYSPLTDAEEIIYDESSPFEEPEEGVYDEANFLIEDYTGNYNSYQEFDEEVEEEEEKDDEEEREGEDINYFTKGSPEIDSFVVLSEDRDLFLDDSLPCLPDDIGEGQSMMNEGIRQTIDFDLEENFDNIGPSLSPTTSFISSASCPRKKPSVPVPPRLVLPGLKNPPLRSESPSKRLDNEIRTIALLEEEMQYEMKEIERLEKTFKYQLENLQTEEKILLTMLDILNTKQNETREIIELAPNPALIYDIVDKSRAEDTSTIFDVTSLPSPKSSIIPNTATSEASKMDDQQAYNTTKEIEAAQGMVQLKFKQKNDDYWASIFDIVNQSSIPGDLTEDEIDVNQYLFLDDYINDPTVENSKSDGTNIFSSDPMTISDVNSGIDEGESDDDDQKEVNMLEEMLKTYS
ncbi:hypothetical protein G9A89_010524 [Geosiphon pyriformis]|nr:hypothetical protein G9A89_010524 [Geosiphon pyriformis]